MDCPLVIFTTTTKSKPTPTNSQNLSRPISASFSSASALRIYFIARRRSRPCWVFYNRKIAGMGDDFLSKREETNHQIAKLVLARCKVVANLKELFSASDFVLLLVNRNHCGYGNSYNEIQRSKYATHHYATQNNSNRTKPSGGIQEICFYCCALCSRRHNHRWRHYHCVLSNHFIIGSDLAKPHQIYLDECSSRYHHRCINDCQLESICQGQDFGNLAILWQYSDGQHLQPSIGIPVTLYFLRVWILIDLANAKIQRGMGAPQFFRKQLRFEFGS